MKNWMLILIRVLASVVMLLVGALLAVLYNGSTTLWGVLAQGLGLAFIVTGSISVFREAILEPLQRRNIEGILSDHEDASSKRLEGLTDQFNAQLGGMSDLLLGAGIRMIRSERQGFPGYHSWLLEQSPQEMTFVGHSVLHRVQIDFESRDFAPVERAIVRKLKESSKVRIVFLDPTWEYLDQIARAENENPIDLRTNLALTLAICRRLWHELEQVRLPGTVDIRTCCEFEQYAYHYVVCREKSEEKMFVGFYFADRIGMKTPLFVVDNERIREEFASHFDIVFARGTPVLHYPMHGAISEFNHTYFEKCRESLAEHLGPERLQRLMGSDAKRGNQANGQ